MTSLHPPTPLPPLSRDRVVIFLAGPTPRSASVPSWRPRAIALLQPLLPATSLLLAPEPKDGQYLHDYDEQVSWEEAGLCAADVILFWIPRDMGTLPGLTTNIEWGVWRATGKCVLGFPESAASCRYLEHEARKLGVPVFRTLEETVRGAAELALRLSSLSPAGAVARDGAELNVPNQIHAVNSVSSWLANQRRLGNGLVKARADWVVGQPGQRPVVVGMSVAVSIASEAGRVKDNECVVFRSDVSTVALLHRGQGQDVKVVLVKEFRSAANNESGYVVELPGGSSFDPSHTPEDIAVDEVAEETGLSIERSRFVPVRPAQLCATLLAHRSHLFAVEITASELEAIAEKQRAGVVMGVEGDGERTTVLTARLQDLVQGTDEVARSMDWSQIGQCVAAAAALGMKVGL